MGEGKNHSGVYLVGPNFHGTVFTDEALNMIPSSTPTPLIPDSMPRQRHA
jgi:hypothetical protein